MWKNLTKCEEVRKGADQANSNDINFFLGLAAPYIYDPKYWHFNDAVYWAKWVYKYESRPTFRKCCFECYHDDTCDFFVDVHSHCFYGRYSYTGSQITSHTNRVNLYVKNGSIFVGLDF